jgi:hypothetical protein
VPPGILAVLRKMMAKSADDRYQQPIEVAEALAEWADRPLGAPPEREMPALCPLVQALAGPSADRAGTQTPLARALFGPGRGVFARAGGSSADGRDRAAAGPDATTTSNVAFPALAPRHPAGGNGSAAALSTARAATAATAPLHANGTAPPAGSGALRPRPRPRPLEAPRAEPAAAAGPRRVWLFVGIAAAVVVLFVAAVVVAYQVGKGHTAGRAERPPAARAPHPGGPVPGPATDILGPAQAAQKVGEVHTVEFKVHSADGTADVSLRPEPDGGPPFVVRIPADYFTAAAGDGGPALVERTKAELRGKVIRTSGAVRPDATGRGSAIEVGNPQQIHVVR